MERNEEKRDYPWLIVKRSRKTGRPVRTISLDPETDAILSQQPNVSEWIREAIREKAGRQAGIVTLTAAESDIYSAINTFYSQLAQMKRERFAESISDEFSEQMLKFASEHISEWLDSEEWDSPLEALKIIQRAQENKEFWRELYSKIRIAYLRDLKRPRGKFGELL